MRWRGVPWVVAGLGLAFVFPLAFGHQVAGADPPADACQARLADWQIEQGDLQPGRSCGSYVGSSNGATVAYSFGQFAWRQEVSPPYRVTVTWRRLGSDARSLELHLLGAVVLLGDDGIALWTDDASFEVDGWHALPGYRTRIAHTVSVEQRPEEIEAFVDGRSVAHWRAAYHEPRGRVSVAFKGQRGARGKMWFADFRLEELAQSHSPATSPARSK